MNNGLPALPYARMLVIGAGLKGVVMKKTQLVLRVTPDLKRKLKGLSEFSMSVVMESAGQHFFSKSAENQVTIIKQFRPRHDRQK